MDVDNFNIPRFLAVLPLFHDLSPAELERVALGCQVHRLGRGDTIFRFGQPCEEFHVVISGQVKLFAISPTGQEKVIELVAPGHSFAEALMFTGKAYILNAESLVSTLLLTISKQSVFDEIERDPRFSMRMLA
ncbi:MAG: cyclic nucleotide-binding domain-containing protein, partial [Comamonadaceae bacterium]